MFDEGPKVMDGMLSTFARILEKCLPLGHDSCVRIVYSCCRLAGNMARNCLDARFPVASSRGWAFSDTSVSRSLRTRDHRWRCLNAFPHGLPADPALNHLRFS